MASWTAFSGVLRMVWLLPFVPRHSTLFMILLSYPITWIITSALFAVCCLRGEWLKRAIRRAGQEAAAQ